MSKIHTFTSYNTLSATHRLMMNCYHNQLQLRTVSQIIMSKHMMPSSAIYIIHLHDYIYYMKWHVRNKLSTTNSFLYPRNTHCQKCFT